MKTIRNLFLAMLLAVVPSAFAQQGPYGTYTFTQVQFPSNWLFGATVAPSVNIQNGWTNTTTSTNIQSLWNASSSAFVSTTNITTNNVLTFANFDARLSQNVPLQFEWSISTNNLPANLSNFTFIVTKSVTGVNYDTVYTNAIAFPALSQPLITNFINGQYYVTIIATTNLNMAGYGYGRFIGYTFNGTNYPMTNLAVYYGSKIRSP
jgi:hypothetical protein